MTPISQTSGPVRPSSVGQFLVLGAWFGLVTGLIEGLGLLLFQRINWENWGRMLHVSEPILWISPLVDLAIFLGVAFGCAVLARLFSRLPMMRVAAFIFAALAVYDWLALMERLYYIACLLLALGAATVFSRWFAKHQSAVLGFCRKSLPVAVAVVVLAFVVVEGGSRWRERRETANLPAPKPGSPNVLIVIMDALRADHVSAYGYPRETSPEIDRLAREGALFENAISASSWSLPSHVSLMTGRYTYEHGADSAEPQTGFAWGQASFRGYPMIGETLAANGYRTAAVSANRVFFTRNDGFGRGFQHFADYFQSPKDTLLRTLYGREFVRLWLARHGRYVLHKRANEVNRELLEWIDRDRNRPFMAILNYFDVHDPYGGPGDFPKPSWPLKSAVDEYDQGLKYTDDHLAQLMRALERRGMASNTLVIVTGDHGESLGQHGLRTHGRALYWELLHVPLVMWYPGHVPAGVRVARPVSDAAIPSTAVDVAVPGATNPFPLPPLSQLWKTPESEANWPAPLSELGRNPYPEKEEKLADQIEPTSTTGALRSVVTPRWHFIVHENLGDQLYDWKTDPQEKHNLVNSEEGRAAAASLAALFPSALSLGSKTRFESVKLLQDGTFDLPANHEKEEGSINDYFRILAAPGSKVTVEVRARHLKPKSRMDPVLALADARGEPLQFCRNPGDDDLEAPAVSDLTPNAFDDLCMNDDQVRGDIDSRLEFLTPAGDAPMDLYVHVLDWNRVTPGRKNYQLTISGAMKAPEGSGGSGSAANTTD